ncbi:hypothetical protein Tco_0141960, partial [Tanacetum coccineum]
MECTGAFSEISSCSIKLGVVDLLLITFNFKKRIFKKRSKKKAKNKQIQARVFKKTDICMFALFSNEMMSDVDVFRPGVLNVVAAEGYGTLVVTVQRDAIELSTAMMYFCECPDNLHDLRLRMLLVPWRCLSDT